MRTVIHLILAMVALPLAMAPRAMAQDTADAAARYVVSYVEVTPAKKEATAALLRQLADDSRKDPGALRFEVLQRTAPSNQFMILEIWKDQQALDAHGAAAHTKQFRDKIAPMLIAPIDDRFFLPIAVAPSQSAPGAVYVVTHVDVAPPNRDKIVTAFNALAGPSRKDAGNLRFDFVQQTNRSNHFNMIEVWRDQASDDAHALEAHTKEFRNAFNPLAGALFDQRQYKAL
jgi:quinol monooxygenase YgiN